MEHALERILALDSREESALRIALMRQVIALKNDIPVYERHGMNEYLEFVNEQARELEDLLLKLDRAEVRRRP